MRKSKDIEPAETKMFEDNIKEINHLISLHVSKWKMKSIPSIDREDVAQNLRLHIVTKLHLYKRELPLGNWLTTVIRNYLKNYIRNFYYKFAKPCVALKCAAYLGGDNCKLYVKTCSACPLFAEWEKEKKQQHDINLPLSIEEENRMQTISETPFENLDILDKIQELKFKLQDKLTSNEFYIFNALYLENKTELEILSELKFSSKTEGLRQIKNLRNNIYEIVKKTLIEEELF